MKRTAIKVCARILWVAGVAVHQLGCLVHALGRATLRLAYRMDSQIDRFW